MIPVMPSSISADTEVNPSGKKIARGNVGPIPLKISRMPGCQTTLFSTFMKNKKPYGKTASKTCPGMVLTDLMRTVENRKYKMIRYRQILFFYNIVKVGGLEF